MATIKVPYITRRVGRNGKIYWYWQRKGFPLKRLPDDELQRAVEADRLNKWADAKKSRGKRADDCMATLVKHYEASERYTELAPGTRKYYDRKIRDVLSVWADLPIHHIDRRAVVDFIESYPSLPERRKARAVLMVLFNEAMYRGWADRNPAHDLHLKMPPKRQQIWTHDDIEAFLDALNGMDWDEGRREGVRLYFALLRYTAQRPNDVVGMTWKRYGGDRIEVVQQKTRKPVAVPCHRELREILDACDRRTIKMLAWPDGREMHYHNLRAWEQEVRNAAKLADLQMRDLRRTAMVRMAEAGAEIHQIAAVSGHSIDDTKQILETYLPRTYEMGREAVLRWESKTDRQNL